MNNNYENTAKILLSENNLSLKIDDAEFENNILEAVIDNMAEELVIFDKNSRFIMINKVARNNPAYNFEIIRNYYDFFEDIKFYDLKDNLLSFEEIPSQRVLRGEKFSDCRLKLININSGLTVFKEYSGTPIYNNNGNIIGGFVLAHYIEDKIKKEEDGYIQIQYNSLKKIIENLDLGFARYTYPEFKIIGVNQRGYTHLKGLMPNLAPQEELKKMSLSDIFDGKVKIIDDIIHDSLRNNKTSCSRISKYKPSEEEVYVKWIYQPLLDLKGEIIEVIIIGVDITKEIKEKYKMEEVLKIQDEIYANVSHEIKTPLNVIFCASQMMDIYFKQDSINESKEKLYDYNNIIKQNCYRLTRLINNIVDLSKSNSGLLNLDMTNVDMVDIVEKIVDSVSIYAKSKSLKIIFNSNVKEKIIACDVNMIERVVLNLISNAIKFSNVNDEIFVSILDKGESVEISVKDFGTGIKKKHLDFIFQRFYQADKSFSRNAEGSGIGLSLVKSIIELHGGSIRVESEIGKGSTFIVDIPATLVEETNNFKNTIYNKIEMLKVEFSDIYSAFSK